MADMDTITSDDSSCNCALFGFSVFALDLSNNPSCSSASSSSLSNDKSNGKRPFVLSGSSSSSHGSKEIKTFKGETETSTSKGIVREESLEREQSSAKDAALFRLFGLADHPCNYFGLAKQAILKCLGLGYQHEKED